MVREIYNNTIREIFKEYFEGDVSKECIICIKECLMFILEKIIKEIIDEYHIDNVNKGK